MKLTGYFFCIILLTPLLFSQGLNMNIFGGESAQAYSYYADEIMVKSLPADQRDPDDEEFTGSIANLQLLGNAWIHFEEDNFTVKAQTITYSRENQTILATDEVVLIQKDSEDPDVITLQANAEKATFFIQENRLVLEDSPIITMGENTIQGEKITFIEDEDGNRLMNVHSGPDKRAQGSHVPVRRTESEQELPQEESSSLPSASSEKSESLSRD